VVVGALEGSAEKVPAERGVRCAVVTTEKQRAGMVDEESPAVAGRRVARGVRSLIE
jgi:hypothetical protein